jgi:hypothetical protein
MVKFNLNYGFIVILLIILVLVSFYNKEKISQAQNLTEPNLNNNSESFTTVIEDDSYYEKGTGTSPVWNQARPIAYFARDTYLKIVPNFTWMEKYWKSRNDYVRAQAGMPPLKESRLSEVGNKVKFNVNTNRFDNKYSIDTLSQLFNVPLTHRFM